MKIGLTGTMSVGKTTLVKALSKMDQFHNYTCTTERSKYLNSLGIPLNHETTIEGQTIFLAERVTELMQDNLITDRTIIDVMAFARCSKSMNYFEKNNFINLAKCLIHEYDYIFYVSPKGVEIENNGVRETNSEYRDLIDRTIQSFLKHHSPRIKNLITVEGSTEERIKIIQDSLVLQYL